MQLHPNVTNKPHMQSIQAITPMGFLEADAVDISPYTCLIDGNNTQICAVCDMCNVKVTILYMCKLYIIYFFSSPFYMNMNLDGANHISLEFLSFRYQLQMLIDSLVILL
jgi:hypothetical protein